MHIRHAYSSHTVTVVRGLESGYCVLQRNYFEENHHETDRLRGGSSLDRLVTVHLLCSARAQSELSYTGPEGCANTHRD